MENKGFVQFEIIINVRGLTFDGSTSIKPFER